METSSWIQVIHLVGVCDVAEVKFAENGANGQVC